MSKSVLVIDTPESCMKCKLTCYDSGRDDYFCSLTEEFIYHYKDNKSSYCPLSPLPEPVNLRQYTNNTSLNRIMNYQYAQGYNDFREEILKGEQYGNQTSK